MNGTLPLDKLPVFSWVKTCVFISRLTDCSLFACVKRLGLVGVSTSCSATFWQLFIL